MSKKSLNIEYSKSLYSNVICNLNRLPFSFCYDGKTYDKAINYKVINNENNKEIINEYEYVIDETLKINYVVKFNKEFGECEYYAYIKNISNTQSKVINNLISLNLNLNAKDPILRGNYGDLVKYYEAYENHLNHGDSRFKQDDGRTSHIVFPYFDLSLDDKGILIALGWAGTWEALFTNEKVIAKSNLNINTCLLPNESIKTALVVLLPYSGNDEDDAANLWREWYVKYNMPKQINGNIMEPFSTCMLANDTGLKNSDGSISENYKTWKPSIDKLKQENLLTDYRWIDAGWYQTPNRKTTVEDWWGSVGAWEVDKVKWPDDSFKNQVDYCHKLNMKTFLWFEPERVTNVDDLVNNFNYKKEWVVETPSSFYNNIGNTDCLKWTVDRIIKVLDENLIDMYREDNNAFVLQGWKAFDKLEEEKYHLPRNGINENKCVLAHYKMLDMIIEYQTSNNKSTFVDICAGGGGRNDIESLRRGIPIMRSDIDRGTSSMRLSQSSTLCRWIVFHGSSTKETDYTYKLLETKGASSYVARASYLPIFNLNEAFTQNKNLNYDQIRKNVNEWKEINHLLTKDFYRLTPYHHNTNKTSWTIFAYNDSYINEGVVLGFRMEDSKNNTYNVKLPFVENNKYYDILNVDTNELLTIKSDILLSDGITLKLDNPKTSILLKIKVNK